MSVTKFIDLDCDGPNDTGCPYDNKIQAESVTVARMDARVDGWAQELLDNGNRIDLCHICKEV